MQDDIWLSKGLNIVITGAYKLAANILGSGAGLLLGPLGLVLGTGANILND